MTSTPSICLIVVGAGQSSRFGGPLSKIYLPIADKPVFLWTFDRFRAFPQITQLLFVVAAADMPMVRKKWGRHLLAQGVQLVAGGPRRCDSVRSALELVDPKVDLIAVHDAARPAVTAPVISAAFSQAASTGAAIVARQISETLKKADSANLAENVPNRHDYWLAQTPQVFRRDLIIQAYAAWPEENPEPTDDAQVVQAFGTKARLVPAGPANIKITTPDDLKLAEFVLLSS